MGSFLPGPPTSSLCLTPIVIPPTSVLTERVLCGASVMVFSPSSPHPHRASAGRGSRRGLDRRVRSAWRGALRAPC